MKVDTIVDNLKPVTFDDFDTIYNFLKRYPSENCDYNICNIFGWNSFHKLEYVIYFDRLILFNSFYSYLQAPVGEKLPAAELAQINNCFKKINQDAAIFAVSEDYITTEKNLSDYALKK